MMRQAGVTQQHNDPCDIISSRELALHSIQEEEEGRSMAASSCDMTPTGTTGTYSHTRASPRMALTVLGQVQDVAAAVAVKAMDNSPRQEGAPGFEACGVDAVDIGLKVANEIMGLHSQAAAAGRALAESNRQAELLHEENQLLKTEVMEAQQVCKALEEEMSRLRAKVDYRGIELLLQEQKLQAAEGRAEAEAKNVAEQAAAIKAAGEKYDALVMRLMVVVVKAAVAIEELDKVQQAPVDHNDNNHQVKLAIHHAMEVLTSLACFKDAWLQSSAVIAAATAASASSAAAPMASYPRDEAGAAEDPSSGYTTWHSKSPRAAFAEYKAARRQSSFSCFTARASARDAGSSVYTPSGASTADSAVAGKPGSSDTDHSCAHILGMQHQLLLQHQQHLQQLQQQRLQRTRSCSPGRRLPSRNRSAAGSEPPSIRATSPAAAIPATVTLGAAASLVYGSILQQKRQLRSGYAGMVRAQTPRTSSRTQHLRSVASVGVPWGSGRAAYQARMDANHSKGLSPPACRTAYETAVIPAWDPYYETASHPPNGLSRAESATVEAALEAQQFSSGQPLQAERSSSSSYTERSSHLHCLPGRRANSTGWY